jgi:hypothetical protein
MLLLLLHGPLPCTATKLTTSGSILGMLLDLVLDLLQHVLRCHHLLARDGLGLLQISKKERCRQQVPLLSKCAKDARNTKSMTKAAHAQTFCTHSAVSCKQQQCRRLRQQRSSPCRKHRDHQRADTGTHDAHAQLSVTPNNNSAEGCSNNAAALAGNTMSIKRQTLARILHTPCCQSPQTTTALEAAATTQQPLQETQLPSQGPHTRTHSAHTLLSVATNNSAEGCGNNTAALAGMQHSA